MSTLKKASPSCSRSGARNSCKSTSGFGKSEPNSINRSEFYARYIDLCRKQMKQPASSIARSCNWRNSQILNILADRVKIEEWEPIWKAISVDISLHAIVIHTKLTGQKYLEFADTEEKVRNIKKWFSSISTKYVLSNLIKSISCCLNVTNTLSCLEFDSILIDSITLALLIEGLVKNNTLRYLAFKGCPLADIGCKTICDALQKMQNIETVILANCNLTNQSGDYLSKLIKNQQLNRYCESWHSSLRYEDPEVHKMPGLRKIYLSNNPQLGDEGTKLILEELVDDIWIQVLDMQRCGITSALAAQILDVVAYSRSLRLLNFNDNQLDLLTIAEIDRLLKSKQYSDDDPIDHTLTLLENMTNNSSVSISTPCKKLSSAQIKSNSLSRQNMKSKMSISQSSKANVKKVTANNPNSTEATLFRAKEQLVQLFDRVKKEKSQREYLEVKCEELQKQVQQLSWNPQKDNLTTEDHVNMKEYILNYIQFLKENKDIKHKKKIIIELLTAMEEVKGLARLYGIKYIIPKESQIFNTPEDQSEADTLSENQFMMYSHVENTIIVETTEVQSVELEYDTKVQQVLHNFSDYSVATTTTTTAASEPNSEEENFSN